MISGYAMRRQDRYLVVYDGEKFDVIEDYDQQFSDIPMSETTTDFDLVVEIKKSFDFVSDYIDISKVVECFRRDKMAERLVANAVNIE